MPSSKKQDFPCTNRLLITFAVRQQVGRESALKDSYAFCNRISLKKITKMMTNSGRRCSVSMTAGAGGILTIRTTVSFAKE